MNLKRITQGMAAIALVTSMGASAAMIKGDDDAVKVDASGLDLSTNQGQEILYNRLERAAKNICGTTSVQQAGSLARALSNRTCVNETLSKAVESVGNQELMHRHKRS